MNYIKSALLPSENILAEGTIHWFAFTPGVFFLLFMVAPSLLLLVFTSGFEQLLIGFLAGAFVLACALVSLIALMYFVGTELALTNKRVIAKFGFITRRVIEINIDKIESAQFDQGVFGRILNFGTVIVTGTGETKLDAPFVRLPMAFVRSVKSGMDDN